MTRPPVINIGFCGLGTVGQGVWKHLAASRALLENRLGARLEVARIAVRDLAKPRDVALPAGVLTTDALAVATDPALPIVCELAGGTGAARAITLAALRCGKIVVSANKALLCEHGAEVFAAARQGGGRLFFEASVAGGVPIVKALREGLVANRFPRIVGILNGTCNHILTRMEQERRPYPVVLAEAKRAGYAETDETLDVGGWDTAHKAAILAFLAHGRWVRTDEMIVEGIDRITADDLAHAAALGFAIKLLAIIERDFAADQLSVRVHPALVPRAHVLAGVAGVNNGISVTGDVVGTTTYIGRGAGPDATASAVIGDLADAVALLRSEEMRRVAGGPVRPGQDPGPARRAQHSELAEGLVPTTADERCPLAPLSAIRSCFYLRLDVQDAPGVLAQIATVLAQNRVSIASVIQRAAGRTDAATLVLTTHESDEQAMHTTLVQLRSLAVVLGAPLLLRIAEPPPSGG